ncbi:MAG TPA: hypothetical protein VG293_02225 [Solirubrobacteraceae bacterium]|nr:hypothetical protein [Solirubrobacteraceae bacterium]
MKDKLFAWERPLRQHDLRDLAELGVEPYAGEILGVRVEELLIESWLLRAPKRLAASYIASLGD